MDSLLVNNESITVQNAQLENTALAEYSFEETQFNDALVTSLTLVIIGIAAVDVGFSVYDISEKRDRYRASKRSQKENEAIYY